MYTVLVIHTHSRRKEVVLENEKNRIQEIAFLQAKKGQKITLQVEKQEIWVKIKKHLQCDFYRNGVLCHDEKLYSGDVIEVVWKGKVIATIMLQTMEYVNGKMENGI